MTLRTWAGGQCRRQDAVGQKTEFEVPPVKAASRWVSPAEFCLPAPEGSECSLWFPHRELGVVCSSDKRTLKQCGKTISDTLLLEIA